MAVKSENQNLKSKVKSLISFGIIAHGGVGAPRSYSQGCKEACNSGYESLRQDAQAVDAVVDAVRVLEDDGRFNAGSGSTLRLDGRTIEMDAAVMDSTGRIGSVIAIRNIRNPVMVARRVLETPHVALAGEGAAIFARLQGLAPSNGVSLTSLRRYRRLLKLIREGRLGERDQRWDRRSLRSLWNFDVPCPDCFPFDTVGAVAVDKQGRFAAAVSTGGASPMLLGRVGDVPFVGCGFYAGDGAAVAVTGIGEEIVRTMLSKTIYDKIMNGADLSEACEYGLSLFPKTVPVGIVAITRDDCLAASNTKMPSAQIIQRDTRSLSGS